MNDIDDLIVWPAEQEPDDNDETTETANQRKRTKSRGYSRALHAFLSYTGVFPYLPYPLTEVRA